MQHAPSLFGSRGHLTQLHLLFVRETQTLLNDGIDALLETLLERFALLCVHAGHGRPIDRTGLTTLRTHHEG